MQYSKFNPRILQEVEVCATLYFIPLYIMYEILYL